VQAVPRDAHCPAQLAPVPLPSDAFPLEMNESDAWDGARLDAMGDAPPEVRWAAGAEKLVDPELDDRARAGSACPRMSEPAVRKTSAAADELRVAELCTLDVARSAVRPCAAAEVAEAPGAEAERSRLSAAAREEQRALAEQLQRALIQPAVQGAMARAEPQSMPRAEQQRRTDSLALAGQQAAESQRAQPSELLPELAERQAGQAARAPGLPASSPREDAEAQQGAGAWPQVRSGD